MFTWNEFFIEESKKEYYQNLMSFVDDEYNMKKIYPPRELIFSAFNLTPFNEVKVIIVGQDPYHNPNQAMGLAFSVPFGVKLPPSLYNIYREIENEFNCIMPNNGDLTYLAKQGVLLINSILTVEENKPLSHANKGYEILLSNVIKLLNDDNNPKVFILWGNSAKKLQKLITNPCHLVLTSAHPSPLSAYNGFFNNNHFIKTNDFLLDNNLSPINWVKAL